MWRLTVPKTRHIVALIAFFSLLLSMVYAVARYSDSYEAAERFLSSDARVTAVVGPVTHVGFKFWYGFHIISSSNGGEANFTYEVTGSKGVAIIEVHLRSTAGVWQVVTARAKSSDGVVLRIIDARASRASFARSDLILA